MERDRPTQFPKTQKPQAPPKSPTALMQVVRLPVLTLLPKGEKKKFPNSFLKIIARNIWLKVAKTRSDNRQQALTMFNSCA